ncbi:MAG: Holliday junction resolvase RuvX [Alphaproteobacteria bacterium]
MAILDPRSLRVALSRGKRILGLDLGERTIGLALSDTTLTIATPQETIRRTRFTADALALERFMAARDVGALLIGLPINMDGSEGPRCQSVRQFAANLLIRGDIPIAFWDERLSTAAVERFMISEADISRKRRAELVDKLAAAYILQAALESMRHPSPV